MFEFEEVWKLSLKLLIKWVWVFIDNSAGQPIGTCLELLFFRLILIWLKLVFLPLPNLLNNFTLYFDETTLLLFQLVFNKAINNFPDTVLYYFEKMLVFQLRKHAS